MMIGSGAVSGLKNLWTFLVQAANVWTVGAAMVSLAASLGLAGLMARFSSLASRLPLWHSSSCGDSIGRFEPTLQIRARGLV